MKNRGIIALLGILIFVSGCKKDEDQDVCPPDSSKPEFKRTEFTLQPPAYFPAFPGGNPVLTEEIVSLGRSLFYEKKLSGDGTQSCASCHNQDFAFTDNGKQFSEGIDGSIGDLNSMAIFNLNWSNGFFWNGRSATLEQQALEPVINPIEMHNTWENAINTLKGDTFYVNKFYEAFGTDDWDSSHAAEAIAQFEKTMLSGNSEFDKKVDQAGGLQLVDLFLTGAVKRGFLIFTRDPKTSSNPTPGGDCFHCHSVENMLFTNNEYMNNGLDSDPDIGFGKVTGRDSDIGKFKVPTLRNIGKTGPYMHDGRFTTLAEVVEFYNSGIKADSKNLAPIIKDGDSNAGTPGISNGLNLTTQEKADLVAFLEYLTDEDFLKNENFSDPGN